MIFRKTDQRNPLRENPQKQVKHKIAIGEGGCL